MDDCAMEYKFERLFTKDYEKWLTENTPWKWYRPIDTSKDFVFFNQVSRKLTCIPYDLISRSMLYMPTNTPGTGERYIAVILAVNGKYDINYDEDDCRFTEGMEYVSDDHRTRIDIYVNKSAKKPKEENEND